jgi:phospholipase/lecithinase/hemolysin
MKSLRLLAPTVLAAALLAACGGGDSTTSVGPGSPSGAPTTSGNFTSVIAFGDSLTDGGVYTLFTPKLPTGAYLGGKFTNNASSAKLWVENVATAIGLNITPAVFEIPRPPAGPGGVVACPMQVACTNYAEGGSRVTDPVGINNADGFATVPLKTQIANHLAKSGGSFKSTDLVFLWTGNNDVFVQANTLSAKLEAWLRANPTANIDQINAKKSEFGLQAHAEMIKAAEEMASYIKDSVLGKGARYVAVLNLMDIGKTPGGLAGGPDAAALVTGLTETFNVWLAEKLDKQPVLWVDVRSTFDQVVASTPVALRSNLACDANKIAAITQGRVTNGTSLFCNSENPAFPFYGIRNGADVNTWLFADSVHPTSGGHKLIGNAVLARLRSAGWVN